MALSVAHPQRGSSRWLRPVWDWGQWLPVVGCSGQWWWGDPDAPGAEEGPGHEEELEFRKAEALFHLVLP